MCEPGKYIYSVALASQEHRIYADDLAGTGLRFRCAALDGALQLSQTKTAHDIIEASASELESFSFVNEWRDWTPAEDNHFVCAARAGVDPGYRDKTGVTGLEVRLCLTRPPLR